MWFALALSPMHVRIYVSPWPTPPTMYAIEHDNENDLSSWAGDLI